MHVQQVGCGLDVLHGEQPVEGGHDLATRQVGPDRAEHGAAGLFHVHPAGGQPAADHLGQQRVDPVAARPGLLLVVPAQAADQQPGGVEVGEDGAAAAGPG